MISTVAIVLIALLFIVFVIILIYGHLNGVAISKHHDDSRVFDDLEFKHWYPEEKLQTNKNFYTLNYTTTNSEMDNDDDTSNNINDNDSYFEDPFM